MHFRINIVTSALSVVSSLCFLFLAADAIGQQAPQPSPQSLQALQTRLENTHWKFVHVRDFIQSGGATIVKDGAWLAIRLRGGGNYSAWHGDKILHENKWEVVDATTIRLHDAGPDGRVGLLMRFNSAFTAFTCPNDPDSSGSFFAKLSAPDLLVGRWHWHGTEIVRFRENGTAIDETSGSEIKWRAIGKDRYEVNWADGKYIDRVRMKSGNNELTCENQFGDKFGARRVGSK